MKRNGGRELFHKFDLALRLGGLRAKMKHKRDGVPIAISEEGNVKIVPPEKIVVNEREMERLENEVRAIQKAENLKDRRVYPFKDA